MKVCTTSCLTPHSAKFSRGHPSTDGHQPFPSQELQRWANLPLAGSLPHPSAVWVWISLHHSPDDCTSPPLQWSPVSPGCLAFVCYVIRRLSVVIPLLSVIHHGLTLWATDFHRCGMWRGANAIDLNTTARSALPPPYPRQVVPTSPAPSFIQSSQMLVSLHHSRYQGCLSVHLAQRSCWQPTGR